MRNVSYEDVIKYSWFNRIECLNDRDYTSRVITMLAKHCCRRGLNYIKRGQLELKIDNHLTCIRCNATKLWFPVYKLVSYQSRLFITGIGAGVYNAANIQIAKDLNGNLIALSTLGKYRYHIKCCHLCNSFYYDNYQNITNNIEIGGYERSSYNESRTVQGYSYITGDYDTYYDVCANCRYHYLNDSDYYTCDDCGMLIYNEDSCYFEPFDSAYCESCYSSAQERWEEEQEDECGEEDWSEISYINDYHGGNHRQQNLGNRLMFGAEYEILCFDLYESKRDREDFCRGLDSFGAITRDASVDLEIVTEPMTLPDLRKRILDLAAYCDRHHVRAWSGNRCGLHIHINRGGIRNFTNIYHFLHKYSDWLLKLSGRTDTHYCEFNFPASDDELLEECNRYTRYLAVNLENEKTIEFRFLRNTTNRERLEAYFDFLDVLFANDNKLPTMTWSELIEKTDNDFLFEMFGISRQYPLPIMG